MIVSESCYVGHISTGMTNAERCLIVIIEFTVLQPSRWRLFLRVKW